jgi:tetratricopeptide (TPR) repeat protein
LFGAFYLAAMFFYIKGKQESFRKRDILIIALCFGLSLFSKIQAVILPISLILVDYYMSKSNEITLKSILNKTPLFLGSLAFGIMGVIFLQGEGSTEQVYTGITRIFIGAYQLLIYYVKAIFPFRMSPLYPYPSSIGWYFYPAILSFIATAFILWRTYFKSKNKVIFFGIAFFFANVALLLQVFGAGQGFLADRFTYIPYFGLFFIMAYYLNALVKNKPNLKNIVLGLTGVVLLAYAFLNFNQNKIWKDSATLWTHVLKHYDHTTLPWGNRANYYRDNGQTQKALYDYGQVIRLKPNAPEPYNSRARLYFNFSQRDSLLKALSNYNKAIELKEDVEYIVNRGATYAKLGNFEKSLENLNHAERIDPTFANIYLNRSVIYNRSQNYPKALEDVTKYLNIKPFYADMWYEKGRLHYILQQYQEAVNACSRAIQNNGKKGLYYFERAKAYQSLGNFPQAKSDLQTSQRLGYKGDANTTNTITNSN